MYDELETLMSDMRNKLTDESQAIISTDALNILSKLRGIVDELDETKAKVDKLEADKSELLKTNGELFRRIGEQIASKDDDETEDETSDTLDEEVKIEDIIDEKGNII